MTRSFAEGRMSWAKSRVELLHAREARSGRAAIRRKLSILFFSMVGFLRSPTIMRHGVVARRPQ
jgi:hypothetical protein